MFPSELGKTNIDLFDLFSWLLGSPWVKRILFYLLCGLATLLFLPCAVPCFIRLIQHVITNMQFAIMVSPDGVKQMRVV